MANARVRRWIDTSTTGIVTLAGIATMALVVLLVGYLGSVVVPLLGADRFGVSIEFPTTISDPVLIGSSHDGGSIHVLDRSGRMHFFDPSGESLGVAVAAGGWIERVRAPIDDEGTIALTTRIDAESAAGIESNVTANRLIRLRQVIYRRQAPHDGANETHIDVVLDLPVDVADGYRFDAYARDEEIVVALLAPDDGLTAGVRRSTLVVLRWRGDPFEGFEPAGRANISLATMYETLTLDAAGSRVLLLSPSTGHQALVRIQRNRLALLHTDDGVPSTWATTLLGAQSLLLARDRHVEQQFIQTTGEFVEVRRFDFARPMTRIVSNPTIKGFVAQDDSGVLHWVHTTAERTISTSRPYDREGIWAFSPRGDVLLLASPNKVQAVGLEIEHAEVSYATLFQRIWYEGYDTPTFTWQSTAADSAFEPKFSIVPLLFGTLKAAFYAMLFAAPLAIATAIYSAYFMSARVRQWIKPSIEIMAALPTVVLGFLAGTLLAPAIEANLASVVLLLTTLPMVGFVLGYGLHALAPQLNQRLVPMLWLAAVPLLVVYTIVLFASDNAIESSLFGGDAARWVNTALGLDYDQRNALVVGIAMTFAVVPVIYSVAEDAIHDVPRSLVNGSLALGASTSQTLVRVVLTTASRGILSALIIGFGRAIGETMVVLMATGNTPILDGSLFTGLRSLAANLAIELPESELDSTHYRVLFLTAVALFVMTFAFNTAAEVIRTRLRVRYGS